MEKIKILIVEDQKTVAASIQDSLHKYGYQVCATVATGEAAINAVQEFSPNLILMDIKLKGPIDGIETTKIINEKFDIPVIYLTSYGDLDTVERIIKTSSYGYIYKPHNDIELNASVQSALHKYIMDKRLKEKEAWLFTTLKSFGDAVITTDKNGYITFINPAAEKLTRWTWEEAIGKPLDKIFNVRHEKNLENFDYFLMKVLKEGTTVSIDDTYYLKNKDKNSIPIDDNCAPIRDMHDNILGAVIVFKDITAQKESKKLLQESEAKFRSLAEQSPNMIFIYQNAKFVYVNKVTEELLAYKREEILDAQFDFYSIFSNESKSLVQQLFEIKTKIKAAIPFDCTLITKNGDRLETLLTLNNISYNGKSAILCTAIDITVRKKMEEKVRISEEKYRILSENALDGIYIIGDAGFEYVNPAFIRLVGYDREELLSPNFNYLDMIHPDDRDLIIKRKIDRGIGLKIENTYTFKIYTKNNRLRYVEANTVRLPGDDLKILGMVRDITDRKNAEEQLRISLAEKEILLKEINHRVKNNLQQILSLLRLQASRVKQEEAVKILRDSQNRVLSISLIHEQLFKAENLSEIDLASYIDSLAKKIYKAFDCSFMHVDFDLKAEKIILDINRALSCGIVVNELISNSFKYAFPENFKGQRKISIHIKKLDNDIIMSIADNGIGLPKDFDIFKAKTLGLQLAVSIVKKQLIGTIKSETDHGTKFIISFKTAQTEQEQ